MGFLSGVKTKVRCGNKRWRYMKEINWLVKDGVTRENNGSGVRWRRSRGRKDKERCITL